MAGLAEEQDQDVVGFRREANDPSSMRESTLGNFQRKLAKVKDFAAAHGDFGES
jgi:hypothetical protein